MNSLLTIETDNSHRVTRHYENWNHERTSTSEDGFLGEYIVFIPCPCQPCPFVFLHAPPRLRVAIFHTKATSGMLNEQRKRITASLTDAVVGK